jgi:hypothetical protein
MLPTIDECREKLERDGWFLGDAQVLDASGATWFVVGKKGENELRASAPTQARAWLLACGKVEMMKLAEPDEPNRPLPAADQFRSLAG